MWHRKLPYEVDHDVDYTGFPARQSFLKADTDIITPQIDPFRAIKLLH